MKVIHSVAELDITQHSRVLLIMPHPDDEAVGSSGFMTQAALMGAKVRVITCTEGEGSTLRYGLKPADDLATFRREELRRAVAVLGTTDLVHWNLPDGGLERSKPRLRQQIRQQIAEFKPTDVFTLEPDGIYGHPDHIALTEVVRKLVKKPSNLWFVTVAPWYQFPSAIHMAKKATIRPIAAEYQLKLTIREIWLKFKALSAHRSQFRLLPWQDNTFLHFWHNSTWWSEFFTKGN